MSETADTNSSIADALEALSEAVGSCPGMDRITAAVAALRGATPEPDADEEPAAQ